MTVETAHRLELLGTFRLYSNEGERIEIASKKGMALVAMLAVAPGGERTRVWLQDRLWGSRQKEQAQQSLRRELVNLRRIFDPRGVAIIVSDHERVRLDLRQVHVDVLEAASGDILPIGPHAAFTGEFLEGFDIPGEEAFEDWLRDQRQIVRARLAQREAAPAPAGRSPSSAAVRELWRETPRLGGRPAVAVLPFANETGDQELAYLASGISDEIVQRLSRLRWMPVIDPGIGFERASGPADRAATGHALGARYLLEGQLSARPEALMLAVALHDTAEGRLIWSDRLNLPRGVPQEAIDQVMCEVVAALDARIEVAEQERAFQKPVADLSVEDRIWRARWHLNRLTREDAAMAKDLLDQVLSERPNSAEALIQATFCMAWSIWTGRQSEARIREMRAMALRAIGADRFDARGHLLVGMAETWLRRPERARLALEESIELNPSLCQAYMQLGSALYLGGDPQAAIPAMRTALRLAPHHTQLFCVLAELGMARLMLGEHREAVKYSDLALIRKPAYWYAHVIKINALVRLGEIDSARAAHSELRLAQPSFTPSHIEWLPFADRKWIRFLREGLERSAP